VRNRWGEILTPIVSRVILESSVPRFLVVIRRPVVEEIRREKAPSAPARRIIIGIAAPTHRADEPVLSEQPYCEPWAYIVWLSWLF
jgi:hypothetical protein